MPITRNRLRSSGAPEGSQPNYCESTPIKRKTPPVPQQSSSILRRSSRVVSPADNHHSNSNHNNGIHNNSIHNSSKQISIPAPKDLSKPKRNPENDKANPPPILEKTLNLLVAATGSVATVKLIELIKKLLSSFPQPYLEKRSNDNVIRRALISIRLVMTEHSKHFAKKQDLISAFGDSRVTVYEDADEWTQWNKLGDPVLHIELRKWADILLIAPLDANTMGKISNGICDNLLTCIVRAWDTSKPLFYCPAMNVHMFNHPITREQLAKLNSYGYSRIDCVEKRLACGDMGMGGMASVDTIVERIIESVLKLASHTLNPAPKPILNQQPTYQIMPTSDTSPSPTKSPSAAQILDRFKTNNQISLHAVNSAKPLNMRANPVTPPATYTTRREFGQPTRPLILSSSRSSTAPKPNLYIIKKAHSGGQNFMRFNGTSSHKPTTITSMQNLKSINNDLNNDSRSEDSDLTPLEDDGDYDFDPSNLMEQSMIIDDPAVPEPLVQGNGNSSASDSLPSNDNPAKIDCLTPLFNTAKFLALCHDKERDCFTCAICKNDYKNRKSMARHLKEQHVQGNIYQCPPCGVSYKRREKLVKHNRERHGIDLP